MSWQDCNATERDVLVSLFREEGKTNREIMADIDRSEMAVSRAVRSLKDKGLVDREDGPTGRNGTENRLSDKGRAVVTAQADKFAEVL
jgi:DNA-binding MarR family transcriptional regulator